MPYFIPVYNTYDYNIRLLVQCQDGLWYNYEMETNEIRKKFLEFQAKLGHKEIKPAPLVLENDPTTLFTGSGMQPLLPYLLGKEHPDGTRLCDSQPCVRMQDVDEVGDPRHTTVFEMLGN